MHSATHEFFSVLPVRAALDLLFQHIAPLCRTREVATTDALGKVLAIAPRSPIDLPSFVRSTMDGYAVRAADTFGASANLPAYLKRAGVVPMGSAPPMILQSGEAIEIYTGAMLPHGADAVVMVERTQIIDENEIEVLAPVAPGENLVQIGEDVRAGAEILPVGHRLRPQDIGGLLGVGIGSVTVSTPPRVALLSSGDELVPPQQTPGQGQVRDLNSYALAALIGQTGAEARIYGIARDLLEDLLARAQSALAQSDMLVLTAGSSVSTRDLTRQTIQQLGAPGILQHGLAVKPGKPTIIAACDGKPVIGLPGNPVSAMLVARQLIIPTIRYLMGARAALQATIRAELCQNIASATGREDTVPVRLFEREGRRYADPIFGKSNLIYTLVNADGVIEIPLNTSGLKAGSIVDVTLFE